MTNDEFVAALERSEKGWTFYIIEHDLHSVRICGVQKANHWAAEVIFSKALIEANAVKEAAEFFGNDFMKFFQNAPKKTV